jgi:hypothetical protein
MMGECTYICLINEWSGSAVRAKCRGHSHNAEQLHKTQLPPSHLARSGTQEPSSVLKRDGVGIVHAGAPQERRAGAEACARGWTPETFAVVISLVLTACATRVAHSRWQYLYAILTRGKRVARVARRRGRALCVVDGLPSRQCTAAKFMSG